MRSTSGFLAISALLCAACTLAGGCGSSSPEARLAPDVAAQPAAGPLSLAPPSKLIDGAELEEHNHFLHGADYAAELSCNRVTVSGDDLLFTPSWTEGAERLDGLAYAMFVFSLEGCDEPEPTLFLSWQNPQPAPSACYIGLGDQARDRWVWLPAEPGEVLQLNNNGPYIGDENSMILTIAVSGKGTYGLSWVRWGDDEEPVAHLSAYPTCGKPPLTVSFNASTSADFDGTIEDYEWDLDGDGTYGEPGDEIAGAGSPTATFTYTEEGQFQAAVRVTDDCGVKSVAAIQVDTTTDSGWTIVTVDDINDVKQAVSLKVVNGHPAVGYVANGWMMYARSTSATGEHAADWNRKVTVDNAGNVGPHCSLAVVDGTPAISYMRFDNGLRYARSSTVDGDLGGDWSQPLKLHTSGDDSSLAVVNGHPAIGFRSVNQVLYLWSSSATGGQLADWDYPVLIDVFS